MHQNSTWYSSFKKLWRKSGQFENGKKPKISNSTILNIIIQTKSQKLSKYRLKTPKCRVRGTPKSQKNAIMNLPRETTNLYVQEYRDITLNTKLGKSRTYIGKQVSENLILSHLRQKITYFWIFFGQNHANLRMARNQKFQLQQY